jgi:hypothetical protein
MRHSFERGNPLFPFTQILVHQSQVVPGVRIVAALFRTGLKLHASQLRFLLRQQGNSQIHLGDREIRVSLQRLLK